MIYNDNHRCSACGFRFGQHRVNDARCPASDTFPKWPNTIQDASKASALFDRRIAKFWSKRTTVFVPKS